MGSIISLGVGKLEVDWGKNSFFTNHSNLFLASDKTEATYYHVDNITELKPAYARSLSSVRDRFELLGYTLPYCRTRYNELLTFHDSDDRLLEYDLFVNMLLRVDISKQSLPGDPSDGYDPGEYAIETILRDPEFLQTSGSEVLETYRGLFFENMDPYVVLRLLAENPNNQSQQVIWRYMDVVDGGWLDEEELFEPLHDRQRYLVVTEGSSDSHIIQRSLSRLRPDIADFFYFVDMTENYSFTGAGNIVRFCQGLSKIRIQNRVIVVLDNDTAGRDAYSRLKSLDLPHNVRVMVLPDLVDFDHFATVGPSGDNRESINGRAVSVELFLDLAYESTEEPTVQWTSFNQIRGQYQGELLHKERYTKAFLTSGWQAPEYRTARLEILLDHLVSEACTLGESLL